ncbi:MAG TPA: NYN domain-containing protein [Acidimicrobiales bacterium]|nr:NYN domain-containing protein [Acidimicrobiales bacterium]
MTTWLVDGTNVMGTRPDGWWRDRPAAQHRLADEVAAALAEPTTVVFDGRDPGGDWPPGLEVRFAERPGPDAADDLIVRLLDERADEPPPTVVTSDRALAARCRDRGAEVVGAGTFLARLG